LIGPILSGVISSFTHNFNTALIGASSAVLIGAALLVNGIQFERKSYAKDEGYTC
jgi:cyanate permease